MARYNIIFYIGNINTTRVFCLLHFTLKKRFNGISGLFLVEDNCNRKKYAVFLNSFPFQHFCILLKKKLLLDVLDGLVVFPLQFEIKDN
jgi:hypothetical protein